MTPKHGFQPQNSVEGMDTLVWLKVDLPGYAAAPGQRFHVTLGSNNGLFKGFIMRAEQVKAGKQKRGGGGESGSDDDTGKIFYLPGLVRVKTHVIPSGKIYPSKTFDSG
jgi:hypothetical protein